MLKFKSNTAQEDSDVSFVFPVRFLYDQSAIESLMDAILHGIVGATLPHRQECIAGKFEDITVVGHNLLHHRAYVAIQDVRQP